MAQKYTKNKIKQEFIQLLNERDLNKITVKDIADRCEINRNTFYYYYSDTYQVLLEVFDMEYEKIENEYNDTLSWEESLLVGTEFIQKNQLAVKHIHNSVRRVDAENFVYGITNQILTRYIEKVGVGIDALDSDKEIIASFYRYSLMGMLLHWIDDGVQEDPVKLVNRVGLLFDGNLVSCLKRSEALKKKESK